MGPRRAKAQANKILKRAKALPAFEVLKYNKRITLIFLFSLAISQQITIYLAIKVDKVALNAIGTGLGLFGF
jgi:hypothetical protein